MWNSLFFVFIFMTGAFTAGFAAEQTPEVFTLRDGRSLIGIYDAKAGLLHLSGTIAASLPVAAEDIAERRPAKETELPGETAPGDALSDDERRVAAIKIALRGLDSELAQRASQQATLEKRIAAIEAPIKTAAADREMVEKGLKQTQAGRDTDVKMLDEIEQARALSETRLLAISKTTIDDSDADIKKRKEIVEITHELSNVHTRIRDLKKRIAISERDVKTQLAAVNKAKAVETRLAEDLAKDQARLAASKKSDEATLAKRSEFMHTLIFALFARCPMKGP